MNCVVVGCVGKSNGCLLGTDHVLSHGPAGVWILGNTGGVGQNTAASFRPEKAGWGVGGWGCLLHKNLSECAGLD